jgi:hypothetical protein
VREPERYYLFQKEMSRHASTGDAEVNLLIDEKNRYYRY